MARIRQVFDGGGIKPVRGSSPSLLKKSIGPDALQAVTRAQKLKMGIESKGRFFVRKGTTRFNSRTPSITERQFDRKRTGLPREKASEARRLGGLDYKTASAREAASKAGDTRLLRQVENSQGQWVSTANPSRKAKGKGSTLTRAAIERFERNRARKLRGDNIPDGEWHEMMDIAIRFKDVRVPQLRLSPKASYTIGK